MWDKSELKLLRSSMVEHIRTRPWWRKENKKLASVKFVCDRCDKVADCEWAFHEETLKECLQEEE